MRGAYEPVYRILKVFERNSFSDAARDLGYTQSAVSQMIKSLEEELGVTLLVRFALGRSAHL